VAFRFKVFRKFFFPSRPSVTRPTGPQSAWDTRRGEEFSERGAKFLNCSMSNSFKLCSTHFPGGRNIFQVDLAPPPSYGPADLPETVEIRVMCVKNNGLLDIAEGAFQISTFRVSKRSLG